MITVCTANLDFAKTRKQHKQYLAHLILLCDILLNQEAKRISLRLLLPRTWRTMQQLRTAARRGSAISWLRPKPHANIRLRVGARPVAVVNGRPKVARMRTRWIAVMDTIIDGKPTTIISAHWPPLRYSWLWPQMDRNVAALIVEKVASGREVLLGADFNTLPARVGARINALLKEHKIIVRVQGDADIDGFMYTSGLIIDRVEVDHFGKQHGLTDHPAVLALVSAK